MTAVNAAMATTGNARRKAFTVLLLSDLSLVRPSRTWTMLSAETSAESLNSSSGPGVRPLAVGIESIHEYSLAPPSVDGHEANPRFTHGILTVWFWNSSRTSADLLPGCAAPASSTKPQSVSRVQE